MKKKLAPSMMCIDLMNVEKELQRLEEAGVDFLHVDIMDNHFVPNITLGIDFVRALKCSTAISLDIHLMVEKPETLIPLLDMCDSNDIITLHYETTVHIQRALEQVKQMGVQVGVALNPGTPLSVLEDLLPYVDMVLVMTVNPGFAGQQLVESCLDKIARLKKHLEEAGYTDIMIEADGNVSFENARRMKEVGADVFVAGTSSIFSKDGTLLANAQKLRDILNG